MEMCYDGALVMPSSYAVMDEEEMAYVDGGISLSWSNVIKIGSAVMVVVGAANQCLALFNNAIKAGATIYGVTEAVFCKALGKAVSKSLTRIVNWITNFLGIVAKVVGVVLAAVGGYGLGSYIAGRVYKKYHK